MPSLAEGGWRTAGGGGAFPVGLAGEDPPLLGALPKMPIEKSADEAGGPCFLGPDGGTLGGGVEAIVHSSRIILPPAGCFLELSRRWWYTFHPALSRRSGLAGHWRTK